MATSSFSKREQDVVDLLLQGKSNKKIALLLGISTSTVEFHLKNIYAKLQVGTRTEAILKLSNNQLGKSTGSVILDELLESTVVETSNSIDNIKQRIAERTPMKIFAYIGSVVLIALITGLFLINSQAKNVGIVDAPTIVDPAGFPITPAISSLTPQIESCVSVHEIDFCVKGVALTKDFTYVMLEIKTLANIQPDGLGFMLPALTEETYPTLLDGRGIAYGAVDGNKSLAAFPGIDGQTYLQTLKFPPLDRENKHATLKFQSIGIFVPLQSSIQLELGKGLQPRQTLSLNQTLELQGQVIHLVKAEFTDSLRLDIWSDPVQLKNGVIAISPRLGIPNGMDIGFGSNLTFSGSPYQAFAELSQSRSKSLSGLLTIPIDGVSLYYQGDFEIPFRVPESGLSNQATLTLGQLAQVAEIRRFFGDQNLEPTFVTFENVNNIWSAMYLTNNDSKYWVETQTGRIIQFEIGEAGENIYIGNKNADDLRAIAEQIAINNSPKFSQLYNGLVLSEKLEGDLYIFRWEYPKITIADLGSPFLQVIVSRGGKVVGYTNILDFVGQ